MAYAFSDPQVVDSNGEHRYFHTIMHQPSASCTSGVSLGSGARTCLRLARSSAVMVWIIKLRYITFVVKTSFTCIGRYRDRSQTAGQCGARAFSNATPTVCNKRPADVTITNSVACFKSRLQTVLFRNFHDC